MRRLVAATRNTGKIKEIAAILADTGFEIVPADAFPGAPEPEETGDTYAENALIKARSLCEFTGLPAIADDSGLEVFDLGGAPGVFSARYAGIEQDSSKNCVKVLKELEDVPFDRRGARFVCTIALATPDGKEELFEGECRGVITLTPAGDGGFGYDPIFFVPHLNRTMAELTPDEKNSLSHRRQALEKLKAFLENTVSG